MKKLILIRHAIAEDIEDASEREEANDSERPLTRRGIKRMKEIARGLAELEEQVDLLVSSPLKRAVQTADLLDGPLKVSRAIQDARLEPEASVEDLAAWLGSLDEEIVALVGHEPQLGRLAVWLMGGSGGENILLKKGGIAIFDFEQECAGGKGRLRLLMQPSQLKKMA